MEDIFKKDLSGAMVSPDDPGYDKLDRRNLRLNKTGLRSLRRLPHAEEVRGFLSRITGQEIDETVTLLPPFYVDYGKNIRFGKRCWIQQGCTFCDRGASQSETMCSSRQK